MFFDHLKGLSSGFSTGCIYNAHFKPDAIPGCQLFNFSQVLLPRVRGGMIVAQEILVATSGVRALIREGKAPQITNMMQTGGINFDARPYHLAGLRGAGQVLSVLDEGEAAFEPLYPTDMSLREKLETIASRVYGADDVNMTPAAAKSPCNMASGPMSTSRSSTTVSETFRSAWPRPSTH